MTRAPFVLAMACALAIPRGAAAQNGAPAADEIAQAPVTQGPMTLERVQSAWAITPDFKVTDFDGGTKNLAGAYGGFVYDSTILFGAGGYWMTNGSRDRDLQYGGAVVEWLERADRPLGFSVRGLLGGGTARLPGTVTRIVQPTPRFDRDGRRIVPSGGPTTTVVPVVFHDDFFVFEPQANALVRLTRLMRLNVGVGYRLTDGGRQVDDRLRGVSGSLGLQIGGITK